MAIKKICKKISWRLRFINSRWRALPDFLIIGAQKCGTTSLWNYLLQHPQVVTNYNNRKEIQYFDQKMNKGLRWYKAHFPTKRFIGEIKKKNGGGNVLVGEATTHYIFHPLAPLRVKEILPKVKIIVLLRNPIDRAYSHYQHEVRKNRENLTFRQAIETESIRLKDSHEKILNTPNYFSQARHDHSYLERGKYYNQLIRWYRLFPNKQIIVLKSEEFFQKPDSVFNRVLGFLGLPSYNRIEYKIMNPGVYENMESDIAKRLEGYFYEENKKLYRFLNIDFENA